MIVDPKKVNLAESDIEQYLFENPKKLHFSGHRINHWIKRQYAVPSGIVDLFGISESGHYVVVEIKNVEIDSKAIAQVCRYAFDLNGILEKVDEISRATYPYPVIKVLVGPSIGDTPLRECESCDIFFVRFVVNFELSVNEYGWTDGFQKKRDEVYGQLAADDALLTAHAFAAQKQDERNSYYAQLSRGVASESDGGEDSDIDKEDVPF